MYIFRAMDLPPSGRRVSTVGASAMSPRSRDNMDTVDEKHEDGSDGNKEDDDDETSSTGIVINLLSSPITCRHKSLKVYIDI